MLTFKKKKLKFVFKNTNSSSEKNVLVSSSKKRYKELVEEYGNDPAYITNFGVKIFPTGEQFVKDAKTGRIIARNKTTRYLGRDEDSGFHLYLGEGSELKPGDQAIPSFVKERELI